MLPKEAIDEFKELYRQDYGVILSDEDATDKAIKLFNVLECIFNNHTLTVNRSDGNN
jgi:hypothetical protein